MRHTDRIERQPRAGVPARINAATHRELRYVAALLTLQQQHVVTLGSLIDCAWEALKQQRPDVQALVERAEKHRDAVFGNEDQGDLL